MSFASEKKVRNAFSKVRCELRKMGLLSEGKPLDQISCRSVVHLSGLVGVMGFYTWGSNVITIPSVFPAALSPYLSGRSLINVFRHEFGHALADKYKRYVISAKFKKAFGGNAFDTTCIAADHYVDEYVSNYAQQCPQEDFAETFMVYIKNKGIFPREYNGVEALYSKWQVIDDICKKIARGKNEHPSCHEAGNQPSDSSGRLRARTGRSPRNQRNQRSRNTRRILQHTRRLRPYPMLKKHEDVNNEQTR